VALSLGLEPTCSYRSPPRARRPDLNHQERMELAEVELDHDP
jgi:hypothetical protein